MGIYSEERKANVLKQLLPPKNRPVPEVAREEGISEATLYNWRKAIREQGEPVPGSNQSSDCWTAEAKVAVVVETAGFSNAELSEYCRKKGLYPEEVQRWKAACIEGNRREVAQRQEARQQSKQDRRRIKALERELRRKDQALAETAALLALKKKINALWEDDNGDA